MIKKNWVILTVTSIIILLPVLAGVILWDQLPEQIPSHWNMAGEIDSYSSKAFAVFAQPLIMLAIQWAAVFATNADPKRQNHQGKVLHLVFWLIPVLNIVLSAVTYTAAMGKEVKVEVISPILVGLIFVVTGNYLPKCKQNYTIGIKIPWTLNSEINWNKTHRLAGWLWVICGLAIMLAGFFGLLWIVVAALPIMVLVPLVYSYILSRKGI